jgi:hypothetical protein
MWWITSWYEPKKKGFKISAHAMQAGVAMSLSGEQYGGGGSVNIVILGE